MPLSTRRHFRPLLHGLLKRAVSGLYDNAVDRSDVNADYDKANRLLRERQDLLFYVAEFVRTWTPDGLPESLVLPVNGITHSYTYTPRRELKDVKIDGAAVATYSWDAAGRRSGVTRANGRNTVYTHDDADRLTNLAHAGVQAWDYRYSDEGDPLARVDLTTVTRGEVYIHDGMHRLADYQRGDVQPDNSVPAPAFLQGWTLDKVGNWSAWNNNGAAETRAHGDHHQLNSRTVAPNPALSQAYDGDLNQTDDGTLYKSVNLRRAFDLI